ncbi:MAG: thrombospondin type 3 repeat-containing protein [bacterium]
MKLKYKAVLLLISSAAITLCAGTARAQVEADVYAVTKPFRQYSPITLPSLPPTSAIVRVYSSLIDQHAPWIIVDETDEKLARFNLLSETQHTPRPSYTISSSAPIDTTKLKWLGDHFADTYISIEKTDRSRVVTTFTYHYEEPQTVRSFLFVAKEPFDVQVTVLYDVKGEQKYALVDHHYESPFGSFEVPLFSSSDWRIEIAHTEPLQIMELEPVTTRELNSSEYFGAFAAEPGHTYGFYIDHESPSDRVYSYDSNITFARDPRYDAHPLKLTANPHFVTADQDGDGIPNSRDNCISISNPTQEDINGNGKGDACDDHDLDGVMNPYDNCIDKYNPDQKDTDGDKLGDACDGQESRFTERYPWLPWVGILVGFGTVIGIHLTTQKKKNQPPPGQMWGKIQ